VRDSEGYADSHCHVSRYWPGSLDNLRAEMDANGVTNAVLVQAYGAGQTPEAQRDGNWRERDHDYLFACVAQYPGTFAPVVFVDPAQPDAPVQLAALAARGASGVRLGANDRSPGDDPFALWRAAAMLGLTISCYGLSTDFASPTFAALVAALPEARIVLEHLASHSRPDATDAESAARQAAFDLARFPYMAIKIPGLGEFCSRDPISSATSGNMPYTRPIPPYLAQALAAFGPQRMLWGSDYPPVRVREGYADALTGPLAQFAAADHAWIFGDAARSYFPMR